MKCFDFDMFSNFNLQILNKWSVATLCQCRLVGVIQLNFPCQFNLLIDVFICNNAFWSFILLENVRRNPLHLVGIDKHDLQRRKQISHIKFLIYSSNSRKIEWKKSSVTTFFSKLIAKPFCSILIIHRFQCIEHRHQASYIL